MGAMYHTSTTSRNGVSYYWYSNADKSVEIILPATKRPPEGIVLESLDQVGAGTAWQRTLARGSKAKTLDEAWDEEHKISESKPLQK